MCDTWTDAQWHANSKPNDFDSQYTLVTFQYNQAGEVARTYKEDDGWYWAVLPGHGNYTRFIPSVAADYGLTADAAALAYIERAGYTLAESPVAVAS